MYLARGDFNLFLRIALSFRERKCFGLCGDFNSKERKERGGRKLNVAVCNEQKRDYASSTPLQETFFWTSIKNI